MDLKLLLPFLAIVALSNAAPSSQSKPEVSAAINPFKFLSTLRAPDSFLLKPKTDKNAIKTVAIGKCPLKWLEGCQNDFAAALGKTIDIFKSPDQLDDIIAGFHKLQFRDGILKLCAAQVKFRNCLTVFYQICTDPLQIFKDQFTEGDSQTRMGDSFQLGGSYDDIEFECGGGLTQGMVNWPCIVKVVNSADYQTKTQPCIDAYMTSIGNDRDSYCADGQVLGLCFAKAYADLNECAKNTTEVQWWICERINRRFKLEGYCEQNTCAALFPKKDPKPSATIEDIVNFVNADGLMNKAQKEFHRQVAAFYQKGRKHQRDNQD